MKKRHEMQMEARPRLSGVNRAPPDRVRVWPQPRSIAGLFLIRGTDETTLCCMRNLRTDAKDYAFTNPEELLN
jgi:hypothetical protein